MSNLSERLAAALRPFAVDIFQPTGKKNEYRITVTGNAVHDAREAVRAYDERQPEVATVEVKINVADLPEFKALVAKLEPLLTLCGNEPKGSKIEKALRDVDQALSQLREPADGE